MDLLVEPQTGKVSILNKCIKNDTFKACIPSENVFKIGEGNAG